MNPTLKRWLLIFLIALGIVLLVNGVAYLFSVSEPLALIGTVILLVFLFFYFRRTLFRLSFLDTPEDAETRKDYTWKAITRLGIGLIVIVFIALPPFFDNSHFFVGPKQQWLTLHTIPADKSFLLHNLFWICLAFVIFLMQYTLRQRVFRVLNWKKLGDPWLKWAGVPALSVGGMGFVSSNPGLSEKLLKNITDNPNVNMNFLFSAYGITILLLGLAFLLTQIGKTKSAKEESNEPLHWFVPAFLLAWIANVLLFTLFFVGIILTIYGHVNNP